MFDGLDELVLPVGDLDAPRLLYRDLLGFREVATDDAPDPRWQDVWGLPAAPRRTLLLGKPRSNGGWIRLVEVPGLAPASPAGRPDRVGAYALDFYLRDADAVEARLAAGGREFVTEAVHYPLPGTEIGVRERMLRQPESGLLHALVQYRPRGTRCVLDHDDAEDTSEVVAAVFMTDDLPGATAFAQDVLGAHRYFSGRFDGPAVEQMLGLDPGEGFDAALFRGPASRNARLEFAAAIPGGARKADPVPRVIAVCDLPDLDAVAQRLATGEHGRLGEEAVLDGVRHLPLATRYGARFVLRERRR